MDFGPNDIVKSCRKLESGLRLGQEGIHACQLGPFCAPLYWSGEEAANLKITKEMIVAKRNTLFQQLNDNHSVISCKTCHMVQPKSFKEVDFTKLGHVDLAAMTLCNLRCNFCGYTIHDSFAEAPYDALDILKEFRPEDVLWDSAVDFNGGEPGLLEDLEAYLEFFKSRKIRVFLYTNSIKYRQDIYDGLANGSIRWVCSSLDAGTPSSFLNIKKKNAFFTALENLTRYAHAGRKGKGELAVKYIFCRDNCSDDDVAGFAYAMLAIRPQKVWLTLDFIPLESLPGDSEDFGGADYTSHIAAYAKLFVTLKKHGLIPGHFLENHLATISLHGKILQQRILAEIQTLETPQAPELLLEGTGNVFSPHDLATFQSSPLRITRSNQKSLLWSLKGKRVLIAPTCALSIALLGDPEIRESDILGFLDQDPVLQGKLIKGFPVMSYEAIPELAPEVILLASHELHRSAITKTISERLPAGAEVVEWRSGKGPE